MVITLGSAGTYTIRVNNPDGGQSSIFSFNVNAALPRDHQHLTVQSDTQWLEPNGNGFWQQLPIRTDCVSHLPWGRCMTLSGTQIQNVSSGSFQMIITFGGAGSGASRSTIRAVRGSNTYSFSVL